MSYKKMETKTIKTPSGIEVVIREWITGGEYEAIRSPITDIPLKMKGDGISEGEYNLGQMYRQSTTKAIEVVVVSVGGKTKNVAQEVLNLRKEDYLFVIDEVNKIVKGESFLTKGGKPADGIASES